MINPAFLSTTYVQIFMATSRIVIIRGHCIYILSCPFKRILSLVFFIIPSLTAFLKRTLHARSKAALQIYFAVIELLYHLFPFYSTIKKNPARGACVPVVKHSSLSAERQKISRVIPGVCFISIFSRSCASRLSCQSRQILFLMPKFSPRRRTAPLYISL